MRRWKSWGQLQLVPSKRTSQENECTWFPSVRGSGWYGPNARYDNRGVRFSFILRRPLRLPLEAWTAPLVFVVATAEFLLLPGLEYHHHRRRRRCY